MGQREVGRSLAGRAEQQRGGLAYVRPVCWGRSLQARKRCEPTSPRHHVKRRGGIVWGDAPGAVGWTRHPRHRRVRSARHTSMNARPSSAGCDGGVRRRVACDPEASTPKTPRAPEEGSTFVPRLRFGAGSGRSGGDLRGETTAGGGSHGHRGAARQEERGQTPSVHRV